MAISHLSHYRKYVQNRYMDWAPKSWIGHPNHGLDVQIMDWTSNPHAIFWARAWVPGPRDPWGSWAHGALSIPTMIWTSNP